MPADEAIRWRYAVFAMTVKEQLLARVEQMSEDEASALLRIADRRAGDPLSRLWDEAPDDDEAWTEADDAAAAEGDADITAGRAVGLDELRRNLAS